MRALLAKIPFLPALYRYFRRRHWTRQRSEKLRRYFAQYPVRKLHLGCSRQILDGWLNTDMFGFIESVSYLDVTQPFPFGDASIDYILTEHMIEHIPLESAIAMINECHRVLRAGGKIRISTPDLERIAGLYGRSLDERDETYIREVVDHWANRKIYNPCMAVNLIFGHDHKFLFDFATMASVLRRRRPIEFKPL